MRYWDSSAIVPLVVEDTRRPRARALFEQDQHMLVWWGTTAEVCSAIARRERAEHGGELTASALTVLRRFAAHWNEITPSDRVRRTAERLLRVHDLRAADSLQLAAALVAANDDPPSLEFACFDTRLLAAARAEGFVIASDENA